jgi:hypothetical protein
MPYNRKRAGAACYAGLQHSLEPICRYFKLQSNFINVCFKINMLVTMFDEFLYLPVILRL